MLHFTMHLDVEAVELVRPVQGQAGDSGVDAE
jgi:hypothetical protein